jgi:aminoglycoside phosphotransferase (APT) family kinase protein
MTIGQRDDAALAAGLGRWFAARDARRRDVWVDSLTRPSAGWSNETLVAILTWSQQGETRSTRVVVRLPPPVPSFPHDELKAQAAVLRTLRKAGIPAPEPLAYEPDPSWLGAPFLLMAHAPGRAAGEVPALDPFVTGAGPEGQGRIQEGFLDVLVGVHTLDWRAAGLGGVLRAGTLAAETRWWVDYVVWAADGSPVPLLRDLADWCVSTRPAVEPPASLCWGDARLGNVMFDEFGRVTAALDWELASIGPAEMDVAWYLALDELTTTFVGHVVPGFRTRGAVVDWYEGRAGRRLRDLVWHELFALVRSAAINDRQARLAAAAGVVYPGVAGEDNPVLRYVADRVERYRGAEVTP